MKFSCTFTDFSLPAGPSVGCVLVAMLAFTSFLFLARTAYNNLFVTRSTLLSHHRGRIPPFRLSEYFDTEKKKIS